MRNIKNLFVYSTTVLNDEDKIFIFKKKKKKKKKNIFLHSRNLI